LKVLKSDKRAIFTAAGKAQQAVDWLLNQHSADNPGGKTALTAFLRWNEKAGLQRDALRSR
jgi:antirestriction protein ArdC